MQITQTPIEGLLIIEPKVWKDNRGYFYESYNTKLLADAGIDVNFVQDNQSFSQKGALRGLHAQNKPYEQGKLVRVLQGAVMDIAVDIRKVSPTYGQYFEIELSGENHKQLWVPPGFLHGFLTLEDQTIFTYKVSNYYHKESEIGVMWNDPDLNIQWSKDIPESEFLLSDKDQVLSNFRVFESPF
ncbi:MAG: dTDP-4-dehydrorhamnose 3,5-epimerase [Candidatus Pedobacter colombiensis]|uniref:dTDP-4-dehydrorhamnose 3,5-epimerase n=1 Tax=Candidatus Pedobacter colombiensis TaxID=3121371 RepID=A0AAJ5W6N3_9SPHI|nr:dTDP-4-dehydrorhamnose 3,5-epimerase [Pedobacter sp.]WEK19012.1 MAG: dTDP-4-dehydrorhamnose 3,5-epimerase [Pedobacter sp.]